MVKNMENKRYQILLTNDDGIKSPGLWAAAEALSEVGYVTVAAPRERLADGHVVGHTVRERAEAADLPQRLAPHGHGRAGPSDAVVLAQRRPRRPYPRMNTCGGTGSR